MNSSSIHPLRNEPFRMRAEEPRKQKVIRTVRFTVAQVTALCGGMLPYADGFAWERVEYFLLEEGKLEPYSNGQILPGPSIIFALQNGSRGGKV